MDSLRSGVLLGRDSPISLRMAIIAKKNLGAAWAYRMLMHPKLNDYVRNNGLNWTDLLPYLPDVLMPQTFLETAQQEQARFDQIFNAANKTLTDGTSRTEQNDRVFATFLHARTTQEGVRDNQWKARLDDHDKQWKEKLDVYNNQLALLAPRTYWSNKAKQHRWSAVAFGASFAGILTTSLYQFVQHVGRLDQAAGQESKNLIATLVPFIAFGFAAIWVLRILGRQLSRHLQLSDDASERATMVLTFLALLNEKTDRVTITEKDRILILHALFRPSSKTTPDDAPPAHWFDLLTSRIGKS